MQFCTSSVLFFTLLSVFYTGAAAPIAAPEPEPIAFFGGGSPMMGAPNGGAFGGAFQGLEGNFKPARS